MSSIQLPSYVSDSVDKVVDLYQGLSQPQKVVVGVAGGLASLMAVTKVFSLASDYKRKPSAFELSGGSIDASKVKSEFDAYSASYGADGTAIGIKDRSKTVQLVVSIRSGDSIHQFRAWPLTSQHPAPRSQDVFYSLVTDFYEWGWGQVIRFSSLTLFASDRARSTLAELPFLPQAPWKGLEGV
jgi:24-methylenesterol C-methyltransferase